MSRLRPRISRIKRPDKVVRRSHNQFSLPPLPDWANYSADPELQQELERCLKIRDGASRILPLAQNRLQQLDAIKTLFVTNEQVLLCLQRVQREKVEDAMLANNSYNNNNNNNTSLSSSDSSGASPAVVLRRSHTGARARNRAHPGLAKLCLSDIRIPLLWRDSPLGTNMQVLMNRLFPQTNTLLSTANLLTGAGDSADKSDSGEQCDGYAVFCLARLGPCIRDTRLIFDIRPGTSDVEFDDKLTFDNVGEDFQLVLEVYAYPPSSNSRSVSVFSRRRTLLMDVGRRAATDQTQSDIPQFGGKGVQNFSNYFELVGRCVARLSDIQNRIRAHALVTGQQQLLLAPLNSLGTTNANGHADGSDASSLATSPTEDDAATAAQQQVGIGNGCYGSSVDPFVGGDSSSEHGLPLFGSLCYRLVAQPYSANQSLRSGLLWIRKLTASPAQAPARLYRCELRDRHLWAYAVTDPERDGQQRLNGLPTQDGGDAVTEATDFPAVSSLPTQSFDRSIHTVPEVDFDEEVNGREENHDTYDHRNGDNNDGACSSDPDAHSVLAKQEPQPISSTPRTSQCSIVLPPRDQHAPDPAPSIARSTATADVASRVPRLVLAVTPKTLFLDANPTLRLISVCDLQELQAKTEPTSVQIPTVRLRSTSTRDLTEVHQPPLKDQTVNVTAPPSGRLFRSPKPPRKLRTIKANAKSRSLSNVKQLWNLDSSSEQYLAPHTGFHSARMVRDDLLGHVSHRRHSRPSMEANLPWFDSAPCSEHRGGSLDRRRPLSALNVFTPTRDLSTSLNVLYGANWTPPKPKNSFWAKVAVSQTIPRPRYSKRNDVPGHTLSRSLEMLSSPTTGPFASFGIPLTTSAADQSSDNESVASEPACCYRYSNIVETKVASSCQITEEEVVETSAGEVALFTFRIATETPVLGTITGQSLDEAVASTVSAPTSEVFEIAASKPDLLSQLSRLCANSCHRDQPLDPKEALFADEDSTQCWLAMFQAHVTEQKTWGSDSFSKAIRIPEVVSSARDAGTRRSLAFV